MKRWIRVALLGATCALFIASASAQQSRVLTKPYKYERPTGQMQTRGGLGRNHPGDLNPAFVWSVYSDRVNNETYRQPDSTSLRRDQLPFLKPLYVLEEGGPDGDYIHVVHDSNLDGFDLSSSQKDYGWVHKSKVLLWDHSLVTENSNIDRKAMILNSVDYFVGKNFDASQHVSFQSAPAQNASFTGKRANLFTFFYVYKTVGDRRTGFALLGRTPSFDLTTGGAVSAIDGWVPLSRLSLWDTRVAVEPNWDAPARLERSRSGGKTVKFWMDAESAREYRDGEEPNEKLLLWARDPLVERPVGEWRRFPVLAPVTGDTGVVEAGVIGRVVTKQGHGWDPDFIAMLRRRIDSLAVKARRINIVFVVDGTLSMSDYFKPMAEGLQKSVALLRRENNTRPEGKRNKYRFGAVVYRDWAERPHGKLLEAKALTDDDHSVQRFLSNIEAFHGDDRDAGEAVFYGLEQALKHVGFRKQETNAIVLVGDAGNHSRTLADHPDDRTARVSIEQISRLISELDCHFFAVQVHHPTGGQSYVDFVRQTQRIIVDAARVEASELRVAYGDSACPTPMLVSTGPLISLRDGSYGGWVLPAGPGNSVAPRIVTEKVSRFVTYIGERTDFLVDLLVDIINGKDIDGDGRTPGGGADGFSVKDSNFEPGILQVLRLCGVPEGRIKEMMKEEKFHLYTRGYAPSVVDGQAEPLFRPVLLMDRTEVYKTLTRLADLTRATSGSAARQQLKQAWIQVLRAFLGDVETSELEAMRIEEANGLVWGIPFVSPLLAGIRLRDIPQLPNERFGEIVREIKKRHDLLATIFQDDNYKYSFRSDEFRYYWLSTDVIP